MRFYPTSDEKFYVGLKTYTSESNIRKKKPPLKPHLYRKIGNVHYIPFWRDIYPPKGTIVDHELCFTDWRTTRTIRCACLPASGEAKFIKLMKCFPAGFLPPPKVLNLKEIRTIQGTLVDEKAAAKAKGGDKEAKKKGKEKKGKKGKKGKK